MDRLRTCVDALRILAKSSDLTRVGLIERQINDYLNTEVGGKERSLGRLRKAIHDQAAEERRGEDWGIARDCVRSLLRTMAGEFPLHSTRTMQ